MYKNKNCVVPNYLLALFPRTDANTVHYNLRNRNDLKTTARCTALYEQNTYEIVRLLDVSNVFFYKLNFQQA